MTEGSAKLPQQRKGEAMKANKYLYVLRVQQHTGYGWEEVDTHERWSDARASARLYRENQPEFPVRIVRGRDPNPAYADS